MIVLPEGNGGTTGVYGTSQKLYPKEVGHEYGIFPLDKFPEKITIVGHIYYKYGEHGGEGFFVIGLEVVGYNVDTSKIIYLPLFCALID